MRDLAAAAKLYGFSGIALDQELYPSQTGGADSELGLGLPRQHPLGVGGARKALASEALS